MWTFLLRATRPALHLVQLSVLVPSVWFCYDCTPEFADTMLYSYVFSQFTLSFFLCLWLFSCVVPFLHLALVSTHLKTVFTRALFPFGVSSCTCSFCDIVRNNFVCTFGVIHPCSRCAWLLFCCVFDWERPTCHFSGWLRIKYYKAHSEKKETHIRKCLLSFLFSFFYLALNIHVVVYWI